MSDYDYEEQEYEIEEITKEEKGDVLELKCDLELLKNQIVTEIKYKVKNMVIADIKKEVKEEIIDKEFKKILKDSISELVTKEALKIFDEGITVASDLGEEKETKTFRQLVKEQTKEVLENKGYYSGDSYEDKFRDKLRRTIKSEIEYSVKEAVKETKEQIQEIFNKTTQEQLSNTMFNLLMQSGTYQKLSENIKLLEE